MDDTSVTLEDRTTEAVAENQERAPGWLLLIHQLPVEPAYLRVKILRRLKSIGSVALKNSVYLLPYDEGTREDFHWVRSEIIDGGGDATLSTAQFLEGMSREELETLFHRERNEEYAELAAAASAAASAQRTKTEVDRLRLRLEKISDRDYFHAPGRFEAEHAVGLLEAALPKAANQTVEKITERPEGSTWVTRSGVHVDRMASAWLIRRFIDPAAKFKFVPPKGYEPEQGEIRFDMFEGEFTHEGNQCTFETLIRRFALEEGALVAIAEIVHDIDFKDETFGRSETPGIASVIRGIAATYERDEERIAAATHVFEGLLARFRMG
jgi:hypothetical protein